MPAAESYDVIVIGAGVVGSATAVELGRRGVRSMLVERFQPGHGGGSSHGPNRIFRFAYPEPFLVNLAGEALNEWRRLESEAHLKLLDVTGGVFLGKGAEACASAMTKAGVEFEVLDASEVARRLSLRIPDFKRVVFQKDTAVVAASRTVETQVRLAIQTGVEMRCPLEVQSVEVSGGVAKVVTPDAVFTSRSVVLAAGSWITKLAAPLGIVLPVVVTREQVAYLQVSVDLPVIVDWDQPVSYLVPRRWGAPGVKVGLHHHGDEVDPEDGPFAPTPAGIAESRAWVEALTGENPKVMDVECCLYTTAPDEEFLIRRRGPIVAVSACSGHGFKFGPLTGKAVAQVALGEHPGPMDRFVGDV